MEKLQLKHIAPYLPYNLNVWHRRHTYPKETKIVILTPTILCYVENGGINTIKPILRQLSDLTKEIEHKGERFVPINQFYREHAKTLKKELEITNGNLLIEFLPFGIVEKLYEWHFDVFGLIEKGLAIDKNSIQSS